jgi:hypothetical protein
MCEHLKQTKKYGKLSYFKERRYCKMLNITTIHLHDRPILKDVSVQM